MSKDDAVAAEPLLSSNSSTNSPAAAAADNGSIILYEEQYRPWWWFFLLIPTVLPLLPLFYQYRVIVTKDTMIEFGYSNRVTSKRVQLADIESAEALITAPPPSAAATDEDDDGSDDNANKTGIRPIRDYGGWGIRKSFGCNWAYIAKAGSGVRLTIKEQERRLVYVFNCEDPVKVCRLITPSKK